MEVANSVPEETENTTPENGNQPEAPKTAEDYMGYDPQVMESLTKAVADDEYKPQRGGGDQEKKDPQELINETLKKVKVDENGKFVYPEDIDPMLKAAVAAAKSFRDTQAAYTRSRQKEKALEAELEAMRKQLASTPPTSILTPDEQRQLDQLKVTDPDKWYEVMKKLEEKGTEELDKKFGEVRQQAEQEAIIEERKSKLAEFNTGREKPLTIEQLELEVPPKWAQDVIDGKLPFEDYLDRAYTFIYGNKVVQNPPKPEPTTDLNKVSGSATPQGSVDDNGGGINYNEVIF